MKVDLVRTALLIPGLKGRRGLPLLLEGSPGTVKTDKIEAVAAELGLACLTLSPGESGEGAFGVTPVPVDREGRTLLTYPPGEWIRLFENSDGSPKGGVLFIDEIGCAPPGLRAALLGLVLARRIGGNTLPEGTRVIGALNPTSESADGWDLPAPLANRCGHLHWDGGSVDDWCEWRVGAAPARTHGKPGDEEKRIDAEWPDAFAIASGLIAGFIRTRPHLLHKMPPPGDPAASHAWPSRRTWDMATHALAGAIVCNLSTVDTEEFIAAFVGEGPTAEFVAYRLAADLPNPARLLDGLEQWTPDPARLDRTYAILSACTAYVVAPTTAKRQERAIALWRICATLQATMSDATVPVVKALLSAGLGHRTPEAAKVLGPLDKVLRDAGIRADLERSR